MSQTRCCRLVSAIAMSLVLACGACSLGGEAGVADASGGSEGELVAQDWAEFFADADVTGTFAVREVGSGVTLVWNPERAAKERRPASTFKILNSLIVLETGVLPNTETVVPWDGVAREVEAWNQDHTLRTGLEVSAVWAFQELARQVGEERMQLWVSRSNYGNADIGGGIDTFWLNGDLRISPLQQVDFLEDLVERDLRFTQEVMDSVSDVLVRERGEGWSWSYKTGTALEEPVLGWLVGITESAGRRFVFAMNLDLESLSSPDTQLDRRVRQTIARQILEEVGALPPR